MRCMHSLKVMNERQWMHRLGMKRAHSTKNNDEVMKVLKYEIIMLSIVVDADAKMKKF